VGKDKKSSEGRLDLGGLQMKIDPPAEWQQIFSDAWRILRDWFYDPGMHGVDWPAMRELYEPMVGHVAHRADLDYILGELGGELNAGHYYVNWGDMPRPDRVDNGLLGAEIEPHNSGYFKIARIFPGENWHESFRSPLTVAGVEVDEGDYILAVDGRSTQGVANFYSLLESSAGRVVTLSVNDRPKLEGAHDEQVRPIARETNLRYLDWVEGRRAIVEKLSGGRIGYIHMPNTAGAGNRELRKFFYPQAHKEALIFDVRYNGGGFIPDRMIELLTRTKLNYWVRRGTGATPTPAYAHDGPKACLINAYSSSGGDAFPYYFRKLGLGPLIGMRTWGGLIGLSGNPGFMDGGSISVPTFRLLDTEGRWDVENVGVAPDIEIFDRPDLVVKGQDPTLEKAIAVLLEELSRNPVPKLSIPEAPRSDR
jgi:tricorn protease